MKAKAVVLRSLSKPPRIEELIIPELKPGQVLVKLAYSGICHTQLSEIKGNRGEDKFLPHVLGHEGSGIVIAAGPEVSKTKVGDRVVISWISGSGADVPSTQYDSNLGKVNAGAVSSFMEYAVISENRVTPVGAEMPLREASLFGCAILTGAGAILNSGAVSRGSIVAVFGTGGIGLSAVMGATIAGASKIIAVDVHDVKLQLAMELGATDIINAAREDPLPVIRQITGGQGVDCALEAAGLTETMELAFASIRSQGGLAILAGSPPYGQKITMDPFELIRGKRISGTVGGESNPDRDIPRFIEYFIQGKLPLTKLITHVYPFQEFNQALACLEEGKAGRVLIAF